MRYINTILVNVIISQTAATTSSQSEWRSEGGHCSCQFFETFEAFCSKILCALLFFPHTKQRRAIIGSGPGGLVMAKFLKPAGLSLIRRSVYFHQIISDCSKSKRPQTQARTAQRAPIRHNRYSDMIRGPKPVTHRR
jgi:hypothetical protein